MGVGQKVASLYAELTLDDAKFQAGVKNAASGVGTLGTKVQKTGAQLRGFGSKLTQMSAPLALVGGYAVKTAIEWEDAFAGVRKTVEGTDEELRDLERGLRDLATSADSPVSALENAHFELASIAEAAGQLGVKTEHIVMFTEQMALLGVATNMTGEEASFMVAQLANVTGMDLETELQGFTAAIVWLGNNTATTEKDILALSQRIAGAGTAAGFAEPQIAGLAAAALSLGFAPERAGTNLSMWLYDIVRIVGENGPALDRFAEIAGMDTSGFKELWEADPQEGLVAFLEGLNELPDAEKFAALEEFGWTAGTLSPLLLALAGNTDLLTFAMDGATTAAEDGSAAYEEAGKRADTAKGAFNKLRNVLSDIAITVGDELLPEIVPLAENLALIVENVADKHPEWIKLAAGILAVGIAGAIAGPIIAGLGVTLGLLSSGTSLITLGVGLLALAWRENWGGIRDYLTETVWPAIQPVLSDIVNWLKTNIPEAVRKAKDIFEDFSSVFAGAEFGDTASSIAEWGSAFAEWVAPATNELIRELIGMSQHVRTWIAGQAELLIVKLEAWASAFAAWVPDAITSLLEKLPGLALELVAWIGDQVIELDIKLLEWAGAFVDWLGPATTAVLPELGTFVGEIVGWILSDGLPLLVQGALELIPGLLGWVFEAGQKIEPELQEFIGKVVSFIVTDLVPALFEAGYNMGKAIVEGAIEGISKLPDVISGALGLGGMPQAAFAESFGGRPIVPGTPYYDPLLGSVYKYKEGQLQGGSQFYTIAPSRDSGGSVRRGQPYAIGTGAQPELFIPDSNGMMYPAGSYGGASIQIGAVYVQDEDPARWLDRLEREASRRNLTLGVARG